MFTKTAVIKLSRETLSYYFVRGKRSKKVFEAGFEKVDLPNLIERLRSKVKPTTVRILVDDDISYIFGVEVPKEIQVGKERDYITEIVREKIPEILEDDDWDFKLLSKGAERKAIIFSPVKEVYEPVCELLKSHGFKVEAVEPELIANRRNEDPIVGIALKRDIKGKDQEVLNIVEDENHKPKTIKEDGGEISEKTRKLKVKNLILIIFLIGIIAACGVYAYLKFFKVSGSGLSGQFQSPTETEAIQQEQVNVENESPEQIRLSDYSLNILNGSGLSGEAAYVKEILTAEGFQKVEIGDADNSDYDVTQVKLKNSVDNAVYDVINRALNSEYELKVADELPEGDFDIEIVVGLRK